MRAWTRLTAPGIVAGLATPLLFASSTHGAPLNVERIIASNQNSGWGASYDAGVNWARGNVRLLELRSGGAVVWLRLFPEPSNPVERQGVPFFRDRFVFIERLHFRRVNDKRIISRGNVHARYSRMWWRRLGSEAFLQAQYNHITLLRARVLTGTGLRIEALHHTNVGIWGGSGYMAEYEVNDTVTGDPHPASVVNHRWTTYSTISLRFAERRVAIRNTVYVQPRFDALADIRVLEAAQLEGTVTERFAMGLELELQYDSRPPQTVRPTDITVGSYLKLSL